MLLKLLARFAPKGPAAPIAAALDSSAVLLTEHNARNQQRERHRLAFEGQQHAFTEAEATLEARTHEEARFHARWMQATQTFHQERLQQIADRDTLAQQLREEELRQPHMAHQLRAAACQQEQLADLQRQEGLELLIQQLEAMRREDH